MSLLPGQFRTIVEAIFNYQGVVEFPEEIINEIEEAYRQAIATPHQDTDSMRVNLEAYVRRLGLWDSSCRWYSQKQWEDRGELIGNGATLSLIFEGPLSQILFENHMVYETFSGIAHDHGLYFELGFSWSLHFYPR